MESLARPGGNVTGFPLIEFSVIGKVVETLKQMAPGISRVGIIYNPDNPVGAIYLNSFKADAARLPFSRLIFLFMGPLKSNAPSHVWRNNRMEASSLRLTLRKPRWPQRSPPLRLVTGFPQSTAANIKAD